MPPAVFSVFLYFYTVIGLLACKKWVQVGQIDSTSFKIKEGGFQITCKFFVTISIFLFSTWVKFLLSSLENPSKVSVSNIRTGCHLQQ
jgi:hypothetical protein